MDDITDAVETIETAESEAIEDASQIRQEASEAAEEVQEEANEVATEIIDGAMDQSRWIEHDGVHAALEARISALEAGLGSHSEPPVIVAPPAEEPPAEEPPAEEPPDEPAPDIAPKGRNSHWWYR